MSIKEILDEITAESSTNNKMKILKKYKDNELLRQVLYMAYSKRVKFYIKQIPGYIPVAADDLQTAILNLDAITERRVTGNEAIGWLTTILSRLSADDAQVIEYIIGKSCKIGMGTSNINKVIPGFIEKVGYMGAKSYSEKLVRKLFAGGKKAISQVKMDGRYCNAVIDINGTEMSSRQGEPTILDNAAFLSELNTLEDCVLNGELTMKGIPRYISNGIISSLVDIIKKREDRGPEKSAKKESDFEKKHEMTIAEALDKVTFTAWDVLTTEEYCDRKSTVPYIERFERLTKLVEGLEMVEVVESRIVSSFEEALQHFKEMLDRGEEGTILKALDGEWKDGKPTTQVKMKLDITLDLKVVGFEYGEKGKKNENVISTINLESSCGLLKTNPSNMDEEMMDYVTENQDKLMGTIVEISCCGLSQNKQGDWSTLHPSVEKLRDDKSEANSLEECQEIQNMALSL